MEPEFSSDDWLRLALLREGFLRGNPGDYWRDARTLELYDTVFARRICWKWDAVIEDLEQIGWRPSASQALDWGCGTGAASESISDWLNLETYSCADARPAAVSATVARLKSMGLHAEPHPLDVIEPGTLLLVSHVLNELNGEAFDKLVALAKAADELIWVEPGNHEASRKLIEVRERLRGETTIVAPCVHTEFSCPMLELENERHWCHFFADPPAEVFQSKFWKEVNRRLEIDLRSLPYSFLAASKCMAPPDRSGEERLIGRPRELKGHCKLLCCGHEGLHERMLQKRDNPGLFREMIKGIGRGLYRWEIEGTKIASGERI